MDGRGRALSLLSTACPRSATWCERPSGHALASQRSSSLELRFHDSVVNIRTGKLYVMFDILIGTPPPGADSAAGTDMRLIWRITAEISPDHVVTIPSDTWEWTSGGLRGGDAGPGGSSATPGLTPGPTPRAEGRGRSHPNHQRGGLRGPGAFPADADPYNMHTAGEDPNMERRHQAQHWSLATFHEQDSPRRAAESDAKTSKGRRGKQTSPSTTRPSPYSRQDTVVNISEDDLDGLAAILPVPGEPQVMEPPASEHPDPAWQAMEDNGEKRRRVDAGDDSGEAQGLVDWWYGAGDVGHWGWHYQQEYTEGAQRHSGAWRPKGTTGRTSPKKTQQEEGKLTRRQAPKQKPT